LKRSKRLKSKYFYCLDHKDWTAWKTDVFASDASLYVPEVQAEPFVGIDTIISWVSASAGDQVSVHHGHMPCIEICSPDTATGIWAMEDILRLPKDRPSPYGYTIYMASATITKPMFAFGRLAHQKQRVSPAFTLSDRRLATATAESRPCP